MNKAARKRLEALCDPATSALEGALFEEVLITCQECGQKTPARIPTSVSVKAATAILDRGGLGPKATMVHEKGKSDEDAFLDLLYEMRQLSYNERLTLAQSILPELEDQLRLVGSKPIMIAGEVQAGDTNSQ